MLKSSALDHFKTARAVAAALGISESAVAQWSDVVPYASAKRLSEVTPSLRIDPSLYDERLRPRASCAIHSAS
jgi:DNA-binding transcriptional regulator YdaS (Cro superfamily)